jgi:hypothetical protein
MRRRRLLLVVGAVALLGVAGFVLLVWLMSPTPTPGVTTPTPAPVPGVTLENFLRLRKGMSTRDVEALLGKPDETLRVTPLRAQLLWHGKLEISLNFFDDDGLIGGCAMPVGSDASQAEVIRR